MAMSNGGASPAGAPAGNAGLRHPWPALPTRRAPRAAPRAIDELVGSEAGPVGSGPPRRERAAALCPPRS